MEPMEPVHVLEPEKEKVVGTTINTSAFGEMVFIPMEEEESVVTTTASTGTTDSSAVMMETGAHQEVDEQQVVDEQHVVDEQQEVDEQQVVTEQEEEEGQVIVQDGQQMIIQEGQQVIVQDGQQMLVHQDDSDGHVIVQDGEGQVIVHKDDSEGQQLLVTEEGQQVIVSDEGQQIIVNEGQQVIVNDEGQQMIVNEEGQQIIVQDDDGEGHILVLDSNKEVGEDIEIQQEEVEEDPILVVVDAETGQHVPIGKHQASAQVKSPNKQTTEITFIETGEDHETVKTVKSREVQTSDRLPRNIQIVDENGSTVFLMDRESESEDESDLEDREFTLIVDEDASDAEEYVAEDEQAITLERIQEKTAFEGETIEDILAQFETESKSKTVSCPNCKKCFVSTHFLSAHISNKSTLCDLCNTQCCTAPNLRNHKNIECDLSIRKRNIDLIAQETALLGRKPIEPEKYYNLPLESSDEEAEVEAVPQQKQHSSINQKIREQEGVKLYNDELTDHHKRDNTDHTRLACGMGGCHAVFDSRGALRKHRSESHPELEEFKPVDLEPDDPDRDADLTVACPVCERKFKHKNTCTVHIKVHHLGWAKKKMFECQDCLKGFDNKKNMELHREAIHLGIRTICPLCDKPVTRLDLHVRMVHTDMPEWPCPDCGKKFKRKFDLNRHRVTVQ